MDDGELDLLRSTARVVFGEGAGLSALADLGVLGLLTPERCGGEGWRVREAVAVAVEGGRALTPVPWHGSVLAAAALAGSADAAPVGGLLAGTTTGALVERPGALPGDVGWRLSVTVPVPGTGAPDVLVVVDPGGASVVAVPTDGCGGSIELQSDPLDTLRGTVVVALDDVPASELPQADGRALADAAVLLACADSLGALDATVDRMLRYLTERTAFGRPLASFQIVQHRLADLTVLVAEADALVQAAATALVEWSPSAHHLVAMAHVLMTERCTVALDDCIQLSGGIGFTWEWPVHHAMRRSLVNSGVRTPRPTSADELSRALAAAGEQTPDHEHRRHVRDVIARRAPFQVREGHRAPTSAAEEAALRAWYRTMYDAGLLGASWPGEWGGRPDHSPVHDLVVTEELIRARAPRPIDQVVLASHVLLHYGTEEQKRRYLPPIRTADDIWCQLFSEPDAGSDLAGIRARADQRPDGSFVLAGQKIWTTDGHWAQYGLALLRTSSGPRRHDGITAFVVPMDAPKLDVRPIRTIGGADEFNEVFLDGVVLGPEHVVGELGQGWAIAMSGLEIERFGVGGNVVLLELLLKDVLLLAQLLDVDGVPLVEDSAVLRDLTRLMSRLAGARAYVDGHVRRVLSGREADAEGPIAKLLYTEAYNAIARYGMELVTAYGPAPDPGEEPARRLQDAWLWSRGLTISGGTSEVMRNIIAKRRLKLPSDR